MRMTQKKNQNSTTKPTKPKKTDWGKEPDESDDHDLLDADGNPPDVHDGGTHAMPQKPRPDPDVVARRASDLVSDKDTLKKVEAELAGKRKVLDDARAKLSPLEQEVEKLRKAVDRLQAAVVADNVDALLAIVPEHTERYFDPDEGPCSDDDVREGRCTRCTLLYIRDNKWDASKFKVEVTVSPR